MKEELHDDNDDEPEDPLEVLERKRQREIEVQAYALASIISHLILLHLLGCNRMLFLSGVACPANC